MSKAALTVCLTVLFGAALTLRAGEFAGRTEASGGPIFSPGDLPVAHESTPMSVAVQNETLQKFCGDCHNDDDLKGEMSLDKFNAGRAGEKAELAEKIVSKLRTGLMPPRD